MTIMIVSIPWIMRDKTIIEISVWRTGECMHACSVMGPAALRKRPLVAKGISESKSKHELHVTNAWKINQISLENPNIQSTSNQIKNAMQRHEMPTMVHIMCGYAKPMIGFGDLPLAKSSRCARILLAANETNDMTKSFEHNGHFLRRGQS